MDPASPAWDPSQPAKNMPAARYAELANEFELLLVAESARWGDTQPSGTRPDHRIFTPIEWAKMRDNLYQNYFPKRSETVLKQFIAGGLYPAAAAPVFSQPGGQVEAGMTLGMTGPGTIYYTLDGSDPRRSALQRQLTQADRWLQGRAHLLATAEEALAVQELVEGMLAGEGGCA